MDWTVRPKANKNDWRLSQVGREGKTKEGRKEGKMTEGKKEGRMEG